MYTMEKSRRVKELEGLEVARALKTLEKLKTLAKEEKTNK